MLDFYLIGDDQPYNSTVKSGFIGGIEEEEFEEAKTAKVIESHLDYYGKFRWSIELVKRKIIQLEQLNCASLSNLTDILKQSAAAECGLFAFGD